MNHILKKNILLLMFAILSIRGEAREEGASTYMNYGVSIEIVDPLTLKVVRASNQGPLIYGPFLSSEDGTIREDIEYIITGNPGERVTITARTGWDLDRSTGIEGLTIFDLPTLSVSPYKISRGLGDAGRAVVQGLSLYIAPERNVVFDRPVTLVGNIETIMETY